MLLLVCVSALLVLLCTSCVKATYAVQCFKRTKESEAVSGSSDSPLAMLAEKSFANW
jgi:hypothetical protein